MDALDIHDPAEEAANRELLDNPDPFPTETLDVSDSGPIGVWCVHGGPYLRGELPLCDWRGSGLSAGREHVEQTGHEVNARRNEMYVIRVPDTVTES